MRNLFLKGLFVLISLFAFTNTSFAQARCAYCKGSGICNACKGSGQGVRTVAGTNKHVNCSYCHGRGSCKECHGKGVRNGSGVGQQQVTGTCKDCSGRGICARCNGNGWYYYCGQPVDCWECQKKGKCGKCKGTGTITH